MLTNRKIDPQKFHLLRAEALCADLIANGVSFDGLVVMFKGSFRKSYSNDIESVERKVDNQDLVISINRDGVYDKLPEGLFHQTKGNNNTATLSAMVGEYKRFRDEERQARKFFQPLEQELFRYLVAVEEQERSVRFGLLNGTVGKELYDFWNIDYNLPSTPASILILIMPWVKQIKANKQLTAKALGMVLGKDVSVTSTIVSGQGDDANSFVLGDGDRLGDATVCGSQFISPMEQWTFTISGLERTEMDQYLNNHNYARILKRFEEIFIPLNVEWKLDYQYDELIREQSHGEILGYGFQL